VCTKRRKEKGEASVLYLNKRTSRSKERGDKWKEREEGGGRREEGNGK